MKFIKIGSVVIAVDHIVSVLQDRPGRSYVYTTDGRRWPSRHSADVILGRLGAVLR